MKQAEPDDVFDRAAVEAVEQYRFAPGGRRHDSAVTINFSLGASRRTAASARRRA
jgi:outer membrane biosynthesis protein TonB